MKFIFLVRLAVINTFKKKLRATLALLGIALTSSVIIVLFGIQIGLKNLIDNEVKSGQELDTITITRRNIKAIKLDSEQISRIKSISGVSDAAELVGLYGNSSHNGIGLNSVVYAVSTQYFTTSPTTAIEGSVESEPQGNDLVVSTKVLDIFGISTTEAIGESVSLSVTIAQEYASSQKEEEIITPAKDYTIKGVIDRGDVPVIYMPIEDVKTQGLDLVSQVNAQLTSADRASSVRESIEQLGLQTYSVQDTIDQINKLFSVINNILLIFGIIVLAITIAATFTIITLTLMEETSQIGFLRIMGLRKRDVQNLFVIQSIIVTFLGGNLGIVLGIVVGFTLNSYARLTVAANNFTSSVVIFEIPVIQVIMTIVLSVIVGWVVGIMPAKRAAHINPLEELLL